MPSDVAKLMGPLCCQSWQESNVESQVGCHFVLEKVDATIGESSSAKAFGCEGLQGPLCWFAWLIGYSES